MHPPSAPFDRRAFLRGAAAAGGLALVGCRSTSDGGRSDPTASGRTPVTSLVDHHLNANPYLAGNFAPVADEVEATDLQVQGTLPAGLQGRFLRNGPNPIVVPDAARHSWFVGDGMVHAVVLDGGRAVRYRNRYVRTARAVAADGGAPVPGPAPLIFDGSNTNVVPFQGQILSVAEGSVPYVIDGDGVTIRRSDFGGGLTHGLSAHAKYDPIAGELHNVSYKITGEPYAVWQVIDASGRITRSVPIDLDVCGMWHTFSLTDTYVVLYDLPVVFRQDRLDDGWVFPFGWDPDHHPRVGLIERDGPGTVRWIDAPSCYVNHDVAAHDTDRGVSVNLSVSERLFDRDPAGPLEAPPRLERWDIDVDRATVARATLDDRPLEFPRAHPGLGLGAARYVYGVGAGPGRSGGGVLEPGNAVLKHDLRRGTVEVGAYGDTRATAEAVFVPDPDRSGDEDGGWLVSYVYDAAEDQSAFAVVDAQDVAAGPIATVALPQRVPFGFHGNWFPDH